MGDYSTSNKNVLNPTPNAHLETHNIDTQKHSYTVYSVPPLLGYKSEIYVLRYRYIVRMEEFRRKFSFLNFLVNLFSLSKNMRVKFITHELIFVKKIAKICSSLL